MIGWLNEGILDSRSDLQFTADAVQSGREMMMILTFCMCLASCRRGPRKAAEKQRDVNPSNAEATFALSTRRQKSLKNF